MKARNMSKYELAVHIVASYIKGDYYQAERALEKAYEVEDANKPAADGLFALYRDYMSRTQEELEDIYTCLMEEKAALEKLGGLEAVKGLIAGELGGLPDQGLADVLRTIAFDIMPDNLLNWKDVAKAIVQHMPETAEEAPLMPEDMSSLIDGMKKKGFNQAAWEYACWHPKEVGENMLTLLHPINFLTPDQAEKDALVKQVLDHVGRPALS